jgi:hypothetical protein
VDISTLQEKNAIAKSQMAKEQKNIRGKKGKLKMNKDKWINIRCTEEQRQDVTELAKQCDMAVSELFWYLVAKERKERGK